MSFYINNCNKCRPGPINNSNMGFCEKALIEVTKVFDACTLEASDISLALTATGFTPAGPTLPLTYISTENSGQPVISDLVITRCENRPNFGQVTGTVTMPLTITYRDAGGVLGTATSSMSLSFNTNLYVPQPALTPVTVKALGAFTSSLGSFTSPDVFNITGCYRIIIKVVADVDLLIPSYGYPYIPACSGTDGSSACPNFENTPNYPTALT